MLYSLGDTITAEQAMRLAIELAKQGRGFVSPNPLVGCVIVDKNGKFVSGGAHLKYGEAHAEINALNGVTDKALLKGASVFVTLEPCAHEGKTGSCAKALGQHPIAEVHYGTLDPNPLVSGQGLKILEAKGIKTIHYKEFEKPCREVCEQFLYSMKHKMPFVALKVGASFDGKIALNSGESQWITGEQARTFSRSLRAHYDATFIGGGTLSYDNPTLDFRDTEFEGKKENRIIILDPNGRNAGSFKESNIKKVHSTKNIFVLTRSEHIDKWSKNLVHVVEWENSKGGWEKAFKNLHRKGMSSIFVEGGSYVFSQLLQYKLAQKFYMFQSNKILGEGVSWSQYFQINKLSEAPQLHSWNSLVMGEDRLHIAYF